VSVVDTAWARRRGRLTAVLLLLAGGGVVVIGSTQPWLVARLAETDLEVTGASALPILQPLALAVLALALVLTLAARALRYVLAALALVAGFGLAAMIAPVAVAPGPSAVGSTVTEHTGLAGDEAVAELVLGIDVTAWPWVGLAGAVAVLAGAVVTLVTAHRWPRGGRRYETAPARAHDGPLDAVDSWDELSHGEDPTR